MRQNLAPEFPTRRRARPLTLPGTALVMIFVILALICLVISLTLWAPLSP
jgi:hypothetical protein